MMPRRFGEFAAPCVKRQKREAGNKTMREPEYYWVRYKGNAIGGMYIHDMYDGWQPALYDAAEKDLTLFGHEDPFRAELFEIGPMFKAPSSLTGQAESGNMEAGDK
jgi:hypothetical protein